MENNSKIYKEVTPIINMKYLLCITLILMFSLVGVSAEQESLGIVKQNECVRLYQTCPSCSTLTISSVVYPDKTVAVSSINMDTDDNFEYYYDFCNTTQLGQYIVNGKGDVDGTDTAFAYDFEVNSSGRIQQNTMLITIFFIIFIIIIFFTCYLVVYSIGHAIGLDFDIIDAAWNYGLFFVLVVFNNLHSNYVGDLLIESYLDWAVSISVWVNLILPTIYFILTLTVGSWMSKRVKGVDM